MYLRLKKRVIIGCVMLTGLSVYSVASADRASSFRGARRNSVLTAIDSDTQPITVSPRTLDASNTIESTPIESAVDKPTQLSAPQGSVVQRSSNEEASMDPAEVTMPLQAPEESVLRSSYENDVDEVDFEAKRATVVELVERAAEFLKKNPDYVAFNGFTHSKDFVRGEIYIFAFDQSGVCLAHGEQTNLLWQNLINMRDTFGTPIVKTILKKGKQGGGWITYQWRGSTKISYVKQVVRGDMVITIGAGYYPHSKADAVVSLVKGAVALFKTAMKDGRSKEEVFSTFSYPMGRFVYGDLYLYALDFKGKQMAHGERPGLIGSNAWNYQSQGKFVNQEIIEKLKTKPDGVWVEYMSKNAPKRSYAEMVTDREGNSYFIACGYYPEANRDRLIDLIRKGYEYMKSHGPSAASQAFSDKKDDAFRYGDIYLAVYDFSGKCIANGNNPDFIGQSFYDERDQDGKYPIRDMITKAKKQRAKSGSGEASGFWINYKMKNSFVSAYVKPIKIGLKDYLITGGLYPITKKETALLLVRSAAGFLKNESSKNAFKGFVQPEGKFIRGDLYIFSFALNGICLAYGDLTDYIWRNMIDVKDDKGIPYVKTIINTSSTGSGKLTYTLDQDQRIVFFERVENAGRMYIVGSGYFK